MSWKDPVRAIGGLLAIITLLVMLSGQFFVPSLTVSAETIAILLAVISALLGVDIAREWTTITLSIGGNDDESEDDDNEQ